MVAQRVEVMPSNATAAFSPAPRSQPEHAAGSGGAKLSIDDRDVTARYEAMALATEANIAALRSTIADLESRLANHAADHDQEAKLGAHGVQAKLKGEAEADLESGAMVPLSPLTGGTSVFAGGGGRSCKEGEEADSSSSVSSSLTCFGVICFKISQSKSKVRGVYACRCG